MLATGSLLLLMLVPSASACHDPPFDLKGRNDSWCQTSELPWGVVPIVLDCVGRAADETVDITCWSIETSLEVLLGCPNNLRLC